MTAARPQDATIHQVPESADGGLVRRSTRFTLRFSPQAALDVPALLRGSIWVEPCDRMVAFSLLTGRERVLGDADLRALAAVPSNSWVSLAHVMGTTGLRQESFEALIQAGLLLGNAEAGLEAELRRREERLDVTDWDPDAAHYHLKSRNQNEDVGRGIRGDEPALPPTGASSDERLQQYLDLSAHQSQSLLATSTAFGTAPPHFHAVPDALSVSDLPVPKRRERIFELLLERKTTRVFDHRHPLTAEELSTLLYYTFGCQGFAQLVPGLIGLRKTSPSGGALHPIEVYPLVLNVSGLDSGLYHYSVERHGLELMRPLHRLEAEDLVEQFTIGQSYFRSAHVLFIMTARWYRNFWKYRRAQKSYRVIHADAGHLSQTLYLLSAEMGLGAFYSGAINDINIEEFLGVEPLEEGVIGVLGCGRPAREDATLALRTLPYVPRETRIV